jgi:hypothetical protein
MPVLEGDENDQEQQGDDMHDGGGLEINLGEV